MPIFSKEIEQLRIIGGSDYRDNVQKILRRVMSKEVMAKFNMKGNRGKLKFETGVCQGIVDSVQKTFAATTEYTIHQVVASYLKYAQDRCGGGGRKKPNGTQ